MRDPLEDVGSAPEHPICPPLINALPASPTISHASSLHTLPPFCQSNLYPPPLLHVKPSTQRFTFSKPLLINCSGLLWFHFWLVLLMWYLSSRMIQNVRIETTKINTQSTKLNQHVIFGDKFSKIPGPVNIKNNDRGNWKADAWPLRSRG